MTSDGFISVKDLLNHRKFKNITFEQIQYVVDANDKKRYELTQSPTGEYLIRASQGHSLKTVVSKDLLESVTAPLETPVIHGTTQAAWQTIKKDGLSKMGRNQIHFAVGLPGDPKVQSGIRETSEVFIYIDVEKARKDGILFYRSSNNVILSDGIQGIIPLNILKK
ncbi:phosphotransferase KptA/Tpt1 [Gilbertella persicaria]|uniref:phosphotransferase KptA/Tpt1 n=1 Tax=Gilbertella persicaria TaxID=101096 RepID=UPI00221F38D0|nr:phosphotransferase KptA/Tpt1 [Gilbertella persicaria]KAI8078084.1 phosphotransferase KptA/Tpt1 [Gilbertella persicaria]